MADAGYMGLLEESIKAHGLRLEKIEREAEREAAEWKAYLLKERKATCAAPDLVDTAVKLVEERLDTKLAILDGKLKATLAQNWILMGGVSAALLKIFGVIP